MSKLLLEIGDDKNDWTKIGEVMPGNPPGSLSNNKPDGTRDIYLFECSADGSKSSIYRSKSGADYALNPTRIVNTSGVDVVKELRIGESYELSIKTDRSPKPRRIRFSQV